MKRFFLGLAAVIFSMLLWRIESIAADKTKITWLGHAAFKIETPSGKILYIDPWLKNPKAPAEGGQGEKADLVLITHGHSDHVGEAVEILKNTNAQLVATPELGSLLVNQGVPKEKASFATLMAIGGTIALLDGDVEVSMVPAVHGSGFAHRDEEGKEMMAYAGPPVGYVIKIKNGATVYHTGDTALFSDMKLISEFYRPDVMLVNIGGHFGMEPLLAARATAWVAPKHAIPMHYGTFPILQQSPKAYEEALKKEKVKTKVRNLKPGETAEF